MVFGKQSMVEALEGRRFMSVSTFGHLGGGNSPVSLTISDGSVSFQTPSVALIPPVPRGLFAGGLNGLAHAIGDGGVPLG